MAEKNTSNPIYKIFTKKSCSHVLYCPQSLILSFLLPPLVFGGNYWKKNFEIAFENSSPLNLKSRFFY